MVFLLFGILMNVGIFSLFRLYPRYDVDTFQAIVINYITCVFTGVIFIGDPLFFRSLSINDTWIIISFLLGGVFIGSFYLMALTTQRFSMTVSSVASKISLAIPVIFALFIFDIESKLFDFWNYLGLVLAFLAIYLLSFSTGDSFVVKAKTTFAVMLPIFVFITGGIIDTTINYTNYRYLSKEDEAVFPVIVFFAAACIGLIALLAKRKRISGRNLKGGIVLGIINYFSLYFIVRALTAFQNDGAIVFPILNMGIIMISALVSIRFFNEKLKLRNKIGLFVALLAIFLISYQELLTSF